MVLNTMEKEYILNPFLYLKKFRDYSILYVPYKHQLKIIRNNNFFDKNKKQLIKNRVLVEKDYKTRFLEFYRKILTKSPFLDLMYIITTDHCNFKCPYCFIENNYEDNTKRKFMSWETAKKGIDYFFSETKAETPRIIFYGGEPTLNSKVLIKSIEYIRSKNKKTSIGINSNGSVYSDKLAEVFNKNNVNLAISVDGFEPIFNKTRINLSNKGMYNIVKQNIDNYIKNKVKVSFSITLNSYNVKFLPIIAKWIIDEFPKIKSVGFNLSLQNIKGNTLFADPEYSAFQIYNAFRIFRKYGIYEDRVMRRLDKIVENKIYLKDCAGCGNQIVLLPDGFVGPCHGFMGMKYDFNNNLENLDFKKDPIFNKWNQFSPVNKPECVEENCPFVLICGNGCPYYSFITKGSLSAKDYRMKPFLSILIEEMSKDLHLKKPKAVFVDYDGVLISRKPTFEVLKIIAEKIHYKKDIEKRDFYDIRQIISEMAKETNYNMDINNLIYLYLKLWKENSRFNLPLLKQLEKLKLPLYIISNNSVDSMKEELGENNNFFKKIFGKGSFSFNKPSKEFYENIFKTTNLKPEEIVYIGDNINDIKPMHQFGIRTSISTYANSDYDVYTDNGWLLDIFDDLSK